MTTAPAHKIRIGALQATIWRNTSDKGPWYSVQLTRSYKAADDEWRETDSLGHDDLLAAAKLLDLAHSWVMQQLDADRKSRKQPQQA